MHNLHDTQNVPFYAIFLILLVSDDFLEGRQILKSTINIKFFFLQISRFFYLFK